MELKSAIKKLHGAFGRNGVDTGAFEIVDKEYNKYKDEETTFYNNPNRPSTFYGIATWEGLDTEQQKKDYLNSLSDKDRKYVETWVKLYENRINFEKEWKKFLKETHYGEKCL